MSQNRGTVIIAVDEPEPLKELLDIGRMLAISDQDRILALTVSLGSVENEEEAISKIERIVADQAEQGVPVGSLVVSATSVARGILDVAREQGAGLILLGLSRDPAQRSGVGAIAENVIAAAPCPVIIYRPGAGAISQVVIVCDAADLSAEALRIGTQLAQRLEHSFKVLTVGQAHTGGATRRSIRRRIEELGYEPGLSLTYINESDPVQAIFKQVDPQTLLVTGYDYVRDEPEDWFYRRVARAVLHGADGPVVLVVRNRGITQENRAIRLLTRVLNWLHPALTPVEQRELLSQADQKSRNSLDYNVLVVIAAILATLGLLANSSTVIIGAMLVAPLMSPLIAFAAAIAAGQIVIVRRALLTLLGGFLVAFCVAWLIGVLSPSLIVTGEMAARGNPSLSDLGVALAGGVIAAYAQARKDIPAALAGVAIAAALMPPICTIGMAVAIGNQPLYQGGLLLFVANVSAITFAAGLTFLYLGVRPRSEQNVRARLLGSAVGVTIFGIILALVVGFTVNPLSIARIEQVLQPAFSTSELVEVEIRRSDPPLVVATIRRQFDDPLSPAEVDHARAAMEQSLGRAVSLEVIVQGVVRSDPLRSP